MVLVNKRLRFAPALARAMMLWGLLLLVAAVAYSENVDPHGSWTTAVGVVGWVVIVVMLVGAIGWARCSIHLKRLSHTV